jgi:hypothetical protein
VENEGCEWINKSEQEEKGREYPVADLEGGPNGLIYH